MVMLAIVLNSESFFFFYIHSTIYKVVNEHLIGVDILVSKDLKLESNKYPSIVRFHGGILISKLRSSLIVSPLSM